MAERKTGTVAEPGPGRPEKRGSADYHAEAMEALDRAYQALHAAAVAAMDDGIPERLRRLGEAEIDLAFFMDIQVRTALVAPQPPGAHAGNAVAQYAGAFNVEWRGLEMKGQPTWRLRWSGDTAFALVWHHGDGLAVEYRRLVPESMAALATRDDADLQRAGRWLADRHRAALGRAR